MARRRPSRLPRPYLERIWLDAISVPDTEEFPSACHSFATASTRYGLEPVALDATEHYRLVRDFCADPAAFVDAKLKGE
jgi:hypothetical protein